MDVVHFNQKQLAARWNISEASLERWRSEGFGPKFLKICVECSTGRSTSKPTRNRAYRYQPRLSQHIRPVLAENDQSWGCVEGPQYAIANQTACLFKISHLLNWRAYW
ncbi:MAG: hypothetical protein Q8O34_16960 [Rhodocyclaceae bacterium]|nr:hypothetical protein [Rhodocyclaceae bacterium]